MNDNWFAYSGATRKHRWWSQDEAGTYISSCRITIVVGVDEIIEVGDEPRCKRCEKIESNGGPVWKR